MTKTETKLSVRSLEQFGISLLAEDFRTLGLELPESLQTAVGTYATARANIDALPTAPGRFDPFLLAGEDCAEQLDKFLRDKELGDARRMLARAELDKLRARLHLEDKTWRRDARQILQGWFESNVKDLAAEGDPRLHPNRAEQLTKMRRAFERAHRWITGRMPHVERWDAVPWLMRFEFDKQSWTALVDATRPGLDLRHGENLYAVALAAGGVPSLALGQDQIVARFERRKDYPSADQIDRRDPVTRQLAEAAAEGWATVRETREAQTKSRN